MDFSNRSAQPQEVPSAAPNVASPVNRRSHSKNDKWARFGVAGAVLAVVILLIGAILVVSSSNNVPSENKYVDTAKLQAVFLNTGQVYFGNIKSLNNQYVVLTNIYYLQTSSNGSSSSSSNSNNNVSLVKLGCELHQPYDQMVINRSQVTFWENLQDTGQVAKAVKAFQQQNPNGQKCSDQSSAASTSSGSTTQNAGSSTPAATGNSSAAKP